MGWMDRLYGWAIIRLSATVVLICMYYWFLSFVLQNRVIIHVLFLTLLGTIDLIIDADCLAIACFYFSDTTLSIL